MIYEFIFSDNPDIRLTNTLDSETYDFRIRWNTREDAWYCYVGYAGADPVTKFKLTVGFKDLLKPYKHLEGCPQGNLFILDTLLYHGRPDYDNTGIDSRYRLFYATVGETVPDNWFPWTEDIKQIAVTASNSSLVQVIVLEDTGIITPSLSSGTSLSSLVVDNGNGVFVMTDTNAGKLFYSTDYGSTWSGPATISHSIYGHITDVGLFFAQGTSNLVQMPRGTYTASSTTIALPMEITNSKSTYLKVYYSSPLNLLFVDVYNSTDKRRIYATDLENINWNLVFSFSDIGITSSERQNTFFTQDEDGLFSFCVLNPTNSAYECYIYNPVTELMELKETLDISVLPLSYNNGRYFYFSEDYLTLYYYNGTSVSTVYEVQVNPDNTYEHYTDVVVELDARQRSIKITKDLVYFTTLNNQNGTGSLHYSNDNGSSFTEIEISTDFIQEVYTTESLDSFCIFGHIYNKVTEEQQV